MTTVTPVTNLAALDELRFLWHARWLETRVPATVQSFAWYWRWATSRPRARPFACAVHDAGTLVGVVPLARRIRRIAGSPFRTLAFPDNGGLPSGGAVGPEPTRTWLAVMDYLSRTARHWDVVDLTGIDPRCDAERIATAARLRRLPLRRTESRPRSNMPRDWPEQVASMWEVACELGTARIVPLNDASGDIWTARVLQEGAAWTILSLHPEETAADDGAIVAAWNRTDLLGAIEQAAAAAGMRVVRRKGILSARSPAAGDQVRYLIASPASLRGRLWTWWEQLAHRVA